jgi:predicted RNA-binding protein YlxR (DUF448 family)
MCSELFEKVLRKANKEMVYKGEDPNSLAAWIYTDVSPTQEGRILLKDKYENFEWDQNISNQNVESICNMESGEGKGFSFYFARYGYNDNYKYRYKSLSTNTETEKNYSRFLATINYKYLNKIIGSQLPKILNPEHTVLLVIDEKIVDSRTCIVSAIYTTKDDLLDIYTEHEKDIILSDAEKEGGYFGEKTGKLRIMLEEKIKLELKNRIIEGTKEFEQLLKY